MARPGRLIWHLFPSYLLITVVCVAAVTWHGTRTLHDVYLKQASADLLARARLLEDRMASLLDSPDRAGVRAAVRSMGQRSGTRLTLLAPDGHVLADSHENAGIMENHKDRPEVALALSGSPGTSVRESATLGEPLLYMAIPLVSRGRVKGALRTSLALTPVEHEVDRLVERTVLWGALVVLLAAAVSLVVSTRLTRPLARMRDGAENFAQGDLAFRLRAPSSAEMASLADAMNRMAADLDERIRTVTRQRNEMEAVLSSMVEGVIAVDPDETILRVNRAAAGILGREAGGFEGLPLRGVVRNEAFIRFVDRALACRDVEAEDITLFHHGERVFHVRGAPLFDAGDRLLGALIVLNDVTRVRRLEKMRTDFVANASHEIKTPLTAIKGFVETLRQGALADREQAERFLDIVARHVDRLQSLVEDLLTLARVEHEGERERIPLSPGDVCRVAASAVALIREKAGERGVEVRLDAPGPAPARVHEALLTQAVVNLLDNAVKFSEKGGVVVLSAGVSQGEAWVRCEDQGPGIPERHLDRVFERFYRVDRARSRAQGGTGLGLSIVKHVAAVHGGRVTVQSRVGRGSTFTIWIPIEA